MQTAAAAMSCRCLVKSGPPNGTRVQLGRGKVPWRLWPQVRRWYGAAQDGTVRHCLLLGVTNTYSNYAVQLLR